MNLSARTRTDSSDMSRHGSRLASESLRVCAYEERLHHIRRPLWCLNWCVYVCPPLAVGPWHIYRRLPVCVLAVLHTWQAYRSRAWWLVPTVLIAGVAEVAGWVARTLSSYDPTSLVPFVVQYALETPRPAVFRPLTHSDTQGDRPRSCPDSPGRRAVHGIWPRSRETWTGVQPLEPQDV